MMRVWKLLACLTLATFLFACAQPTSPPATSAPAEKDAPVRGGTLRAGLTADLGTLDPHLSTQAVDRQVYQAIFDTLVTLDPDLNIGPGLAESWTVSADGRTVTFKLRKGVTYHDGTPFNAESVKWNVERMKNRDTGSLRVAELAPVAEVRVVDEHTAQFILTAPFTPLFALLTDRAGMMVSRAAVEKFGKDFARNPVGTGPFSFVEWVKDDHITVRRNPNYWNQEQVYLDQVIYKPIPDDTVRITNVRTGNVEIIDSVPPKDVAALRGSREVVLLEGKGLGYRYVIINVTRPPMDKKQVRQALAWAMDREAMHKALFFGTGTVAQGIISPSHAFAYDPSFAPYPRRDLDKARALLAEAGYKGESFKLTTDTATLSGQMAQAMAAQWAEAGIKAEIETLQQAVVVDNMVKGNHTATLLGWSGRSDPDDDIHRFFHSKGPNNNRFGNYKSPELDEWLDTARQVPTGPERARLYQQVQAKVADDAPMLFWHFPGQFKALSPRVKGYVHIPDGMMRFVGVWLAK